MYIIHICIYLCIAGLKPGPEYTPYIESYVDPKNGPTLHNNAGSSDLHTCPWRVGWGCCLAARDNKPPISLNKGKGSRQLPTHPLG